MEDIDASIGNGGGECIVKKLYLIPKLHEAHKFGSFPFSINFLTQVFAWGQARTDH
jgi:hypothetical protein